LKYCCLGVCMFETFASLLYWFVQVIQVRCLRVAQRYHVVLLQLFHPLPCRQLTRNYSTEVGCFCTKSANALTRPPLYRLALCFLVLPTMSRAWPVHTSLKVVMPRKMVAVLLVQLRGVRSLFSSTLSEEVRHFSKAQVIRISDTHRQYYYSYN